MAQKVMYEKFGNDFLTHLVSKGFPAAHCPQDLAEQYCQKIQVTCRPWHGIIRNKNILSWIKAKRSKFSPSEIRTWCNPICSKLRYEVINKQIAA